MKKKGIVIQFDSSWSPFRMTMSPFTMLLLGLSHHFYFKSCLSGIFNLAINFLSQVWNMAHKAYNLLPQTNFCTQTNCQTHTFDQLFKITAHIAQNQHRSKNWNLAIQYSTIQSNCFDFLTVRNKIKNVCKTELQIFPSHTHGCFVCNWSPRFLAHKINTCRGISSWAPELLATLENVGPMIYWALLTHSGAYSILWITGIIAKLQQINKKVWIPFTQVHVAHQSQNPQVCTHPKELIGTRHMSTGKRGEQSFPNASEGLQGLLHQICILYIRWMTTASA